MRSASMRWAAGSANWQPAWRVVEGKRRRRCGTYEEEKDWRECVCVARDAVCKVWRGQKVGGGISYAEDCLSRGRVVGSGRRRRTRFLGKALLQITPACPWSFHTAQNRRDSSQPTAPVTAWKANSWLPAKQILCSLPCFWAPCHSPAPLTLCSARLTTAPQYSSLMTVTNTSTVEHRSSHLQPVFH